MLFRLRMAGLPVRARVRHQVPAPACGGPSGVASGGQTHLRWVSRYAGRRCSRFGRSSCLGRPTRPAAPAGPGAWIDQPWARPAQARLRKSSAGPPPCRPAAQATHVREAAWLLGNTQNDGACGHKKTRLCGGSFAVEMHRVRRELRRYLEAKLQRWRPPRRQLLSARCRTTGPRRDELSRSSRRSSEPC